MEIDRILEWDFVSKDGKLRKKVEKAGFKGPKPSLRDICTVVIDNEEKTLTLGDYNTSFEKCLHRCISTMDRDEECLLECTTHHSVHLKTFSSQKKVHKMSVEEKLELCKENKEKGVDLFKNGQYEEALDRFQRALVLSTFGGNDLYNVICNNIALCLIKTQRYEDAVEACGKILKTELNLKSLLRRASAYRSLNDYEKAFSDLLQALKIHPNHPQALQEMAIVNQKLQNVNNEFAGMCRRMFQLEK